MKSNIVLQILFLVLAGQFPLKNAQQTNTTLQSDGKGLKAITEAKNETVEVKIDPIKKEMTDFMRECGVEVEENTEAVRGMDKTANTNKLGNLNMAPMVSDNLNDARKKKKKKGTYPTSYGNTGKKGKNKKRRGNNDCDDDIDDSCEDDDDDNDDDDSDEDEDDRRRGKGKKKGGRRGRDRRDLSTLVERFNTTEGGQVVDAGDKEMNEDFKNKKSKRRGGGNRDDNDDDEEEDDDDDGGGGNRCGGRRGKNKGGRGGGKGKNRGSQGGGKKNKGGRGGRKGGGGGKKTGGGGDGFGGGEGGSHGGSPFDTDAGGMGPGMGDNYGYPGLSGSGYFHGNPYGYGAYGGYIRQLDDSELISRIKRQEEKIECVSQCVFGYMEILDDNRVPSETALISYYQEKIVNNAKKSETIRNVRRCFAKLVATDTEDGCKFSKSVSNCLNLDLEP